MKVMQMSCPSCQAPLKIPTDIDRLSCAYCGSDLVVKHGEDFSSLKMAEQVSQTIQETGVETQNTIREGTTVTQSELKRLQLGQELSSLQMQLMNVQGEIRTLERSKRNRQAKRHLKELYRQEQYIKTRISTLNAALAPPIAAVDQPGISSTKKKKQKKGMSPLGKGCLYGCLTYVLIGMTCGVIAIPLDAAIFGQAETGGPIFSGAAIFGFILGVVIFVFYYKTPNGSIWQWMRMKLGKNKEPALAADSPISENEELGK